MACSLASTPPTSSTTSSSPDATTTTASTNAADLTPRRQRSDALASASALFPNRIADARAAFGSCSPGVPLLALSICAFLQAALKWESGVMPEAFSTLSEAEWEIFGVYTVVLLALTHALS
ncbi:hypothetical protein DFH07DRAFT_972079 [Mycena maculata]|uniref:Uncharacterized protein n=1 Tax=Mycena maculata TaxID=230809 RepID=A0AAD7MKQ6_9AGAR|nr:hypothetical protein DFH07DRAFT_972079 [Mycena maculata]